MIGVVVLVDDIVLIFVMLVNIYIIINWSNIRD